MESIDWELLSNIANGSYSGVVEWLDGSSGKVSASDARVIICGKSRVSLELHDSFDSNVFRSRRTFLRLANSISPHLKNLIKVES